MNWSDFGIGFCAGLIVMAGLGCWMFDWFARGLAFEDIDEDSELEK